MKIVLSARLKAFLLFIFAFLAVLGAVLIYDKYSEGDQNSQGGLETTNADSLVTPKVEAETESQSTLDKFVNFVKSPLKKSSEKKPAAKPKPYVYTPAQLPEINVVFKAEPLDPAPENLEDDFLPLLNTVPMRADSVIVGIRNRGNSCYADSVLQMLFRTPIIRKIVANLDVYYPRIKAEVDRMEEEAKAIFAEKKTQASVSSLEFKRTNLINAVKALEGINHIFQQLQENKVDNSARFSVNKSVNSLPGHYKANSQEDAEEYFGTIVDMINDFLPPSQRHHLTIVCSLSGPHRSIGTEPEQVKEYRGTEPVTRLSLNMSKQSTSVMKMLREYFATEEKELKFSDEDPKIDGIVSQTRKLSTLPEILPIQLQRRQYDVTNGLPFKLVHDVFVPTVLDLKEFLEDQSLDARYALKMFVRHSGGANGGHYIAYTVDSEGYWHCINDDAVTKLKQKSPDAMTLSYFYFYQRIMPGDPEPDLAHLTAKEAQMLELNGHEEKNLVISNETKQMAIQRRQAEARRRAAESRRRAEAAGKRAAAAAAAAAANVYTPLKLPAIETLFKAETVSDLNPESDFLSLLNTVPMRTDSVIVGIKNRGNSGYASSVLQTLFRNPLIRKIIANLDVFFPHIKAEVDRLEQEAKAIFAEKKTQASIKSLEFQRKTLINAIKTLEGINHVFQQLQINPANQPAEYSVTKSLQSLPGRFAAQEKEDADEYFGTIIDMISEILPPQQRHHLNILCSLEGTHEAVGIDPVVTRPYQASESVTRLSLTMSKETKTLSDMLNEYFANEKKDLKFDDEHAGVINQTRKLAIPLPDILTLQIQRKQYDVEKREEFKYKRNVTVPFHLDLTEFLNDPSAAGEAKYTLKSFIRHDGEVNDGLYTAYFLVADGSWYKIANDRIVNLGKRLPTVVNKSYMYFYQKTPVEEHEN